MKLDKAMQLATQFPQSVLATHKRDGRAQLSNVLHVPWDDGTLRISVTDNRAKTVNLRRDPRCELYIRDGSFWKYLVLEAEAEVSPVTTAPDDAVADELVEYYRRGNGEHPNWDEYRAAMIKDQRLMLRLRVSRAYGQWFD
jgi:PPOX class probable F420-dependent enzyme